MTEQKELQPIYVASRASIPERGAMWRRFRKDGIPISSTWIDEDGQGQTQSFSELWERVKREIIASNAVVVYAESGDFPLKGVLIEVGIALGMGKHIFVCLPNVELEPRSFRPIGSWINHPLVTRIDNIEVAINQALYAAPVEDEQVRAIRALLEELDSFSPKLLNRNDAQGLTARLAKDEVKSKAVSLENIRYLLSLLPVQPARLGMDTNWPLKDVLNTLADAVEHLGHIHDCDCDGWEIPQGVIPIARDYAKQVAVQPAASTPTEREDWYYISAWGDNKPVHITKSTSVVLHQGGTHSGLCGAEVLGVDGYAIVLNGHEQSPVCHRCKEELLAKFLSASRSPNADACTEAQDERE